MATEAVSVDDCIVTSETRVSLSVRHVDAEEVRKDIEDRFAGRTVGGSVIISGSIEIVEIEPAIMTRVADPAAPFFVSVRYRFREFRPIVGEVYDCRVDVSSPKGTVLKLIDGASGVSLMTVTVPARYTGSEGDTVPVLLTAKYADNGQENVVGLGEFADSE